MIEEALFVWPFIFRTMLLDHSHDHSMTAFAQCCRGAVKASALPPRDGPIVPSNCQTHLVCKPVHPVRPDPWGSWSEWLGHAALIACGSVLAIGGCLYGKTVIDRNRKKRRDERLIAEGKRPPSDGEEEDDSDDDLRGERG